MLLISVSGGWWGPPGRPGAGPGPSDVMIISDVRRKSLEVSRDVETVWRLRGRHFVIRFFQDLREKIKFLENLQHSTLSRRYLLN